ncbi:MAG: phosphodiesterase [Burkholderiales bacterium]
MAIKVVQVSDIHLVQPGDLLYGLDPLARLRNCLADINTHHADAALCVLSGDLADAGQVEAYRALRSVIAELKMPCRLLLGNHDNRENFFEVFPDAPRDEHGFAQSAFIKTGISCIFLDTLETGCAWGRLCDKRLAWLGKRLAESAAGALYLFMHHPPFPIGIKEMDAINLRDTQRFFAVIEAYRERIRHIFFGHVHRPVAGAWRGIGFSAVRGTNHQVALDFEADCVKACLEPPAYAIALLDGQSSVVHYHDFLDQTAHFDF